MPRAGYTLMDYCRRCDGPFKLRTLRPNGGYCARCQGIRMTCARDRKRPLRADSIDLDLSPERGAGLSPERDAKRGADSSPERDAKRRPRRVISVSSDSDEAPPAEQASSAVERAGVERPDVKHVA